MGCDSLVSTAFVVVDHLEAELSFGVAVGLEGSGFLVVTDAVAAVVGFLAAAVEDGRLTSFLAAVAAAVAALGGCAAVNLPVDGAVVTLEAAVLAAAVVEGLAGADVGLDVVDVGRDVEGAVAGLVVLEVVALTALVVVEVLDFGAVEATVLTAAVVLSLAVLTVSGAGFFLAVPFVVGGLVPFVTEAEATEVVLEGPTGFLSGTLVWFLAAVETAATPIGLLGTAPAVDDFAVVVIVVFLPTAAEALFEDLTSFTVRCEEPGRGLDMETPAGLAAGCFLVPTALGLTVGSAATGLPLAFGAAPGAASFAACSGSDEGCSVKLSCSEEGSATAAASVGSVVSMVTPSGFIPSS